VHIDDRRAQRHRAATPGVREKTWQRGQQTHIEAGAALHCRVKVAAPQSACRQQQGGVRAAQAEHMGQGRLRHRKGHAGLLQQGTGPASEGPLHRADGNGQASEAQARVGLPCSRRWGALHACTCIPSARAHQQCTLASGQGPLQGQRGARHRARAACRQLLQHPEVRVQQQRVLHSQARGQQRGSRGGCSRRVAGSCSHCARRSGESQHIQASSQAATGPPQPSPLLAEGCSRGGIPQRCCQRLQLRREEGGIHWEASQASPTGGRSAREHREGRSMRH
jgi:hypothetical protein